MKFHVLLLPEPSNIGQMDRFCIILRQLSSILKKNTNKQLLLSFETKYEFHSPNFHNPSHLTFSVRVSGRANECEAACRCSFCRSVCRLNKLLVMHVNRWEESPVVFIYPSRPPLRITSLARTTTPSRLDT